MQFTERGDIMTVINTRTILALVLSGLTALAVWLAAGAGPAAEAASDGVMSLNATGASVSNCTATDCDVTAGSTFDLNVSVDTPPANGYFVVQGQVFYGGLTYNDTTDPNNEVVWPDKDGQASRSPAAPSNEGAVSLADISEDNGFLVSTFTGNVVSLSMTCPLAGGSFQTAIPVYDAFANPAGSVFVDGLSNPVLAKSIGVLPLDYDFDGDSNQPDYVDVADDLTINCVADEFQDIFINSLTAGLPAGPMGNTCYEYFSYGTSETFEVCDNETGLGVDTANACNKDGDNLCLDEEPGLGTIRVAVLSGQYDVTAASAAGHALDGHLKFCDPPDGEDVKCTFTHTPNMRPWQPWDITGTTSSTPDGLVRIGDILAVIQHYFDDKPLD
jgi:hypothetical protein